MKRLLLLGFALAATSTLGLSNLACSGDDPLPVSPADDGAGNAGATVGAGSTGAGGADTGLQCAKSPLPQLEVAPGCVNVGTVTGQVLDQFGNAPTNTTITLCGNACFYGDLEADGTFSMTVDHCYDEGLIYRVPVFIYHGWPEWADVTVKFVPDGVTDVPTMDIGVIKTFKTDSMTRYPYEEPVAATFTEPGGFSFEVEECAMRLPAFDYDVYVGEVGVENFPLPDAPTDLLALYFVGPDNTYFADPSFASFPNTTGLAADTVVEIMALGNMGTTGVIEAGTWDVIGTGRVTSDGQSIVSDPVQDSGLTSLGWIGYRAAL
ncbi:hypothetical protein JYT28_00195 [Desulfobulbus sp. AH-315-M07]|nr:hypothetical protein [Desulfobulbus sp. AH-315-M07]